MASNADHDTPSSPPRWPPLVAFGCADGRVGRGGETFLLLLALLFLALRPRDTGDMRRDGSKTGPADRRPTRRHVAPRLYGAPRSPRWSSTGLAPQHQN